MKNSIKTASLAEQWCCVTITWRVSFQLLSQCGPCPGRRGKNKETKGFLQFLFLGMILKSLIDATSSSSKRCRARGLFGASWTKNPQCWMKGLITRGQMISCGWKSLRQQERSWNHERRHCENGWGGLNYSDCYSECWVLVLGSLV